MSSLCSLPSELFSLIFGATRGSISDEALQLVCRRFRYHALDTPSFWVDICDEMPSEHISQRLERCGELQLYLTVSHGLPGRNQQCKCTKWEIIKRHANKFRSVWIRLMQQEDGTGDAHYCVKRFAYIHWESLSELTVDGYGTSTQHFLSLAISSIFRQASTPNLKTFCCNDTALLTAIPETLRGVHVRCTSQSAEVSAIHILSLFTLSKNVRRFDLDVRNTQVSYQQSDLVVVDDLSELNVTLHNSLTAPSIIAYSLKLLKFVGLRHVRVMVDRWTASNDVFLSWLSWVGNTSGMLETVEVCVHTKSSSDHQLCEVLERQIRNSLDYGTVITHFPSVSICFVSDSG